MTQHIFLHGVPDTPAMWSPLIGALGLVDSTYHAPAMPGFGVPIPAGFTSTKKAYVDWFIGLVEAEVAKSGPVNVIGHDWGALITMRAVSLRPDLFQTWTVANALPHPDYKWHTMARRWQTPILGEFIMALIGKTAMRKALTEAGVPADLAATETRHWNGDMKRAILRLYRSAKDIGNEWYPTLENAPDRGLIFWGDDDPYVPVWVAQAVAEKTGARLEREANTGHWSIIERADELAVLLRAHWT
jgi:pimeloyl-ACP methyl ester carboxylesterase